MVVTPHALLYVVSRWRQPTETFVRREIAAARTAGHRVVVLSLRAPSRLAPEDPEVHHLTALALIGGVACSLVRRPLRSVRVVLRSLRFVRPRTLLAQLFATLYGLAAAARLPEVDWAHAHFAWVAATTADAFGTLREIPVGITAHAFDVYDERVLDRLLDEKLRRAALLVVVSDRIKDDVEARAGRTAHVVRVGVPRSFVTFDPPPRDTSDLVLSIGSLSQKKGHDVLLRALTQVRSPWRCEIAGDGPERRRLTRLASELGIDDRVRFLGEVAESDVGRLLDSATVFCLACRVAPNGDRDGIPTVLVEAMARGVATASTTVSGIPELLGHDRGVLVPPEDAAGLASAIERLLREPDLRERYVKRAREHVLEHYVVETNWQRLHRLIVEAA